MTPFISIRKQEKITVEGKVHYSRGDSILGYVKWMWDGQTLTVKNDRLGFRPLFYFQNKETIAVSTSLIKLVELGAPLDLDETALAVFLRLGYFLAFDTPFSAIRALPPNAVLTWENGKFDLQFRYIKPARLNLTAQEAPDAYNAAVRRSFVSVLPRSTNIAVPLSGGRDSRNIFLELLAQGVKPRNAITLRHLPPRANEDARIAAQLCEAGTVEHVILDQPEDRIPTELRKNLLTNFCALEHGWYLAMADYLAQAGFDRLYDGIAADVFLEGYLWKEPLVHAYAEQNWETLAEDLLEPEGYLPGILTKTAYRRFDRPRAVAHLKKELLVHADAPNPLSTFQFWNRTRRAIALAPFAILDNSCEVCAPFLTPTMIDFLLGLPYELVADKTLRLQALQRAYTSFAPIPFERKDAPLNLDVKNLRRFSRELLFFTLTKKSAWVRPTFLIPRVLRCHLQSSYSPAVTHFAWQTIYLLQLEQFIKQFGGMR